MNSVLEFLKVNAKAVVGFVVGLLLNAIQDVINGNAPWPHSLQEWGKYLGTAVITGVVVWATGNKLTEKQIVKGAVQQGISVVTDEAVNTVTGVTNDVVQNIVEKVPGVPQNVVIDVAQQVSSTVNGAIKGVAKNFPLSKLEDIL